MAQFLCRSRWQLCPVLFLVLSTVLLSTPAVHSQVNVDPGRPDAFDVSVPSSAQAGVEFQVTIRVLDAEDNVVENYEQLDRQVILETTGGGELSRTQVSSSQFTDGVLTLSLTYDEAEDFSIIVSEQNYVATGRSDELSVRPGPPTTFSINTPGTARAGDPFSLELTARDEFGNRVRNYRETTNGILLRTDGVEGVKPGFLSVGEFNDGRLQANLTYTIAETIRVIVVDEVNQFRVASDTVTVQPAPLNTFTVSVPGQATAGQPFQAAIEAKDQYGNIVTNYPQIGQGVHLEAMARGDIEPDYLPPEQFNGGVAFTELTYNRSGPMRIRVQDRGSSSEGTSERIEVRAGEPTSYRVRVPDEVEAGQSFDVRIEVTDAFGNRVRRYSEMGQPVSVGIRGRDSRLTTLAPGRFDDGRATVSISQTQAGSVRVEAQNNQDTSIRGQSDQVVVVPSSPGQLSISSPDSVTAGEDFTATIRLEDEYGNVIRSSGSLAGAIHTSIIDHGSSAEKTFSASQFIEGTHEVSFSHEGAEEIRVFAEYREYDIRTQGPAIDVQPAEFDHFAIRTPGEVTAGESFSIGLQMRDEFGNALQSMPEDIAPLHLFTTGSDNLEPVTIREEDMSVPNFVVSAQYYIAESMAVKIRDRTGNEVGVSTPIRVSPAQLASFQIDVPDEVKTTQQFPLRLEARDPYNNVITTLNEREGSVALATTGSGEIDPQVVPYSDFVNGVAELRMQYRVAEDMQLQIRGNGTESQSRSITVQPGPPDQFQVAMQDRVQAGVPFPAVVEVYDKHNNRIRSLPNDFAGVGLSASSARRLSPRRLSASLFEDGRAEVYLAYPEAGPLSVSASELENPVETPLVERFYVERDINTARLHLVSSHRVPATVEKSSASGRIQVMVQPAELASDRPPMTFNRWFVKRIAQRQVRFSPLPNVVLSIYPQETVQTESNFNQNLFTLELSASADTGGATLMDIRSLIDQGNYDRAGELLDEYIEQNPDDEQASQLRLRLNRVEELMNP